MSPSYSQELMCRHSPFKNAGEQIARCRDCDWTKRGSQGTLTAAARRHVLAHQDHTVDTTRVQQKTTYMRKVTVLR